MYLRRKKLQREGHIPAEFPKIDFNDRIFRHGIDIVLVATIVNLLVVSVASYRGASYMDSPQFCGQSCHVMHPEYAAYQVSSHSHVDCVQCHIGNGAQSYFEAKVNGTRQLIEVTLRPVAGMAPKLIPTYPTPIPSPVRNLRPAREICEACHTPTRFDGEKLLVKSSFADDEQNTETQTVVVLHLGGRGFAVPPDRHSRRAPGPHRIHRHRRAAHHHSVGAAAQRGRLGDGRMQPPH